MDHTIELSFDRSTLVADRFFQRRLVPKPAFQPPTLREDVLVVAQRAWIERTRSEYIGVMIARRFWALLVDINAPVDVQELALRMVLDEQRHAHLCVEAAASLGAAPDVTFDLVELQQARTDAPLHEQVMQMVVQTYAIGEVTALGLIKHALSALPNSGYRDVLKTIASDEVLHARIGPALLALAHSGQAKEWLPWPGDEKIRRWAQPYFEAMLARDVVEYDELELFADPEAAAQLNQVGVPRSDQFKDAYQRTLKTEVLASFEPLGGLWLKTGAAHG